MKNIVLIGMSGTGKTTIGKELSHQLNREFIDTDILIENRSGITIDEIFAKYGEEYFRDLESRIVFEVGNVDDLIISTGGGIILRKKNIIKLREKGILILLESSIENIVKNIFSSTVKRPLINRGRDIFKEVENMYEERKELYHSAADYIVHVDNKSIKNIVYEILEICDKINSCGK
ncbi:MAG: shikimate kinase [Tissierellia bacterium]|nr:shikimate kinase [Tissierellia bacterium]